MLPIGELSELIQAAPDLDIAFCSIRNFIFQIKFQCTAMINFQNQMPKKINGIPSSTPN